MNIYEGMMAALASFFSAYQRAYADREIKRKLEQIDSKIDQLLALTE